MRFNKDHFVKTNGIQEVPPEIISRPIVGMPGKSPELKVKGSMAQLPGTQPLTTKKSLTKLVCVAKKQNGGDQ